MEPPYHPDAPSVDLPALRSDPGSLAARVRLGLSGADLLEAMLATQTPNTRRAYAGDLKDFAIFLQAADVGLAVEALIGGGPAEANAVALAYRAHLIDARGLAAATVGRRLAAMRMVVKAARTLGRVAWSLEVRNPRSESYRDTTGPGREGWLRVLAAIRAAAQAERPKGVRDLAICLLLHDHGLRRDEVCGLDLAHLDDEGPAGRGVVWVLGKGKSGRLAITLNTRARAAIQAWLAIRGVAPGPLFHRLDRAAGKAEAGGRLDGSSIYGLVGAWGRAAGLGRPVRPHGLRHQGITHALDLTRGDVRKVQRFSRHAKVETVLKYDDAREDEAGDVARLLGEDAP